jgi:hypothetical protein
MTCPKCQAIMFEEPSLHHQASADYTVDLCDARLLCRSWHCLICGTYTDAVIRRNQAGQRLIDQAETIAIMAALHTAPVCPEPVREGQ